MVKLLIVIIFSFTVCFDVLPSSANSSETYKQRSANQSEAKNDGLKNKFRKMANDLISDIDSAAKINNNKSSLDFLKKEYNYSPGDKLRIAVSPFNRDQIPINQELAQEFNDHLITALIKQIQGRYILLARDEINALVDDMQSTGSLENQRENPLTALMENAGKVDVLILGRIRTRNSKIFLSYKAISMNGRLIGTTERYSFDDTSLEIGNVSLEQAVRSAAKNLVDGAGEIAQLHLGGIRFEETGVQPAFGLRFRDLIGSEIAQITANVLTNKKLVIISSDQIGFLKRLEKGDGDSSSRHKLDDSKSDRIKFGPMGLI